MDELIISTDDNNEAPDSQIQQPMESDTTTKRFFSSLHPLKITHFGKKDSI